MSFAPTVEQIRQQVMVKLRLDPADGQMALYWINQAYADVAQFSSFYRSETTVTLAEGDDTVPLPDGVQMVRQVQRSGDSRPAQLVRMEQLLSLLNADSTVNGPHGNGGVYAMSGQEPNELRVWPAAQAGETFLISYSTIPPQLSDSDKPLISEPFGSKILEYGALVEGAKFKKDPMVYDYEATLALWVDRYVGWLNRRKTGNSVAFEVWAGDQEIDRLEAESEHWGVASPA